MVKSVKIAQLEAEVQQVKIKVNQLERYSSKDCLIFRNLPTRSNGSYLQDIVAFIREVLQVEIEPYDIKACHSLGPANHGKSPTIGTKFVYFDQKERIWSRKKFLKIYKNPINGLPVFMHERLSKTDVQLKEAAEKENLLVATNNSAPMVKIEINGQTKWHVIDSMTDINELKANATKLKRPTTVINSGRQNGSATHFIPRTPLPQLFRQPGFMPMIPQSTTIPTLKRSRDINQLSDTSIINELKSRVNSREDLFDYVMRLVGDPPPAKESNMGSIMEEPHFPRIEEDNAGT